MYFCTSFVNPSPPGLDVCLKSPKSVRVSKSLNTRLLRILRRRCLPAKIHDRARLILRLGKGDSLAQASLDARCSKTSASIWRRRWIDESPSKKTLLDWLQDRNRSGRPPIFSLDQRCQIIALACESPADHGLPLDRWTGDELRARAIAVKIVPDISARHVQRILAEVQLKPHRHRYWLNAKADPLRAEKIHGINQIYLHAPELATQGILTFSLDEMTGIQALERIAPDQLAQPGRIRRVEHEYKRHGTLCLLAAFNVVAGTVGGLIRPRRTETDFLELVQSLVAQHPEACGFRLVMDNLNTHQSESLVRYVAEMEGTPEAELGSKGQKGILKSQATRRAYLNDHRHRVSIAYTPKHASWMNQIEIVLGIIKRKAIGMSSFSSRSALQQRLEQFIVYYNKNLAHPFKWTYGSKPLVS